jgi:acylphosphatase
MSSGLEGHEVRGYRVRGEVQGVGFRLWTQRTAARLGLSGHVRNLPGGDVEVQARGSPEMLDALERALLAGPPAARVQNVERMAGDARVPMEGFLVEKW